MRVAIALMFCATLGGCEYFHDPLQHDPGNPAHDAYAGQPGSVYDAAANPPRDIGQVAYDPNAPLPRNLPADATLPSMPGTTLGNRPRSPL